MSLASPDLFERMKQGAFVGYIILLIGVVGLSIAAWRLIVLGNINKRVKQQQKELNKPQDNNPLGRVLNSYYAIPKPVNIDVLEAKMTKPYCVSYQHWKWGKPSSSYLQVLHHYWAY